MNTGEIVGGLRRLFDRLREQDQSHTDSIYAAYGAERIETLERRIAICMDLLMHEGVDTSDIYAAWEKRDEDCLSA